MPKYFSEKFPVLKANLNFFPFVCFTFSWKKKKGSGVSFVFLTQNLDQIFFSQPKAIRSTERGSTK